MSATSSPGAKWLFTMKSMKAYLLFLKSPKLENIDPPHPIVSGLATKNYMIFMNDAPAIFSMTNLVVQSWRTDC